MRFPPGLDLLSEREGSGPVAELGHTVVYNVRIFLNRGDEVSINPLDPTTNGDRVRRLGDEVFSDHVTRLGSRQAIAGIERSLLGMRAGGYREVRVSPHLAYGKTGVEGSIPPDAVLNISLWLREIAPRDDSDC